METRDNAFLENEPIGKLMSKYAVPLYHLAAGGSTI